MMRSIKWLFPASLTLSLCACAGELKKPERFEIGESAATAAEEDAGKSEAPGGDGGGGASACGSTVELLKTKCGNAGCHGGDAPAADLDLAADGVAMRLRDAPSTEACEGYAQIDSAEPSQSLIYLKVTDNPPCAPRMPIGVPLSQDEQACLLQWLEQL